MACSNNCDCDCNPTTVHTPNPCSPENVNHSSNMRLFTLRCGSWVYNGQMPINSTPVRGMRLMWEGKAYTVEQSTLVGSDGNIDKWEVMLIQVGPGYYNNAQQPCTNNVPNPCMPCQPTTQPPIEPRGGLDHNSPCTDPWYNSPMPHNGPSINYPNTPLPVEIGLGCGPHYRCTSYPQ